MLKVFPQLKPPCLRLEDVSEKAQSFGQGKALAISHSRRFGGAGEVVAFAALLVSGVS